MKSRRMTGVCGLVFVVLSSVILFVAPAFPTFQTPLAETLRYYIDNGRGFLTANFLATLALIPSLFFASHFADKLEQAPRRLSKNLFLLVTALSHAVAFMSLIGFQTAALVSHPGQEIIVKLVSDASNIAFCFYLLLQGLYLSLFAAMAFYSKILPRWCGWVALPVVLVSFAASLGTVFPIGPLIPGEAFVMVSSIGIGLWIAAVSVYMVLIGD